MIEGNRKEFDLCNILRWHQLGYTGKGIKIAEIEAADPTLSIWGGTLHDPLGYGAGSSKNSHGQKVLDIMHQVAPDAEIYTLPGGGVYSSNSAEGDLIEKTIPFVMREGIDIVGASLIGTSNKILAAKVEEAQTVGTVFVCSMGNEGTDAYNKYAVAGWIAVGALGWNESAQRIELKGYSSQGPELDLCAFSGLWCYNAINPNAPFLEEGTSFSQPMAAGMIALVQQFFAEKTGRKLNQSQMLQFIQDNTRDLGAAGRDDIYGHGLFVLPEPNSIDVKRYIGEADNVTNKEFIQSILPGALASYRQQGVLPSLTLAQAILESGWGKSGLAVKSKNLFGIKWSAGCGYDYDEYQTSEYVNGQYIKVMAKFRKYSTYLDSIMDHGALLQKTRYKPVLAAKDYKEAATQVQACGYATSPTYASQLINLIEGQKLNQWDRKGYKMFNDFDQISGWAKDYVEQAAELGIMVGDDKGNFNPQAPVTREQLAKVVCEVLKKK